ncbi:phosphatase PAP2 family protein [Pseudoduganella lutea]|uniref:Phosphatase PAP2 family protein n=1 Tax=Pseudoduganella lutea TaxID=321985 RepID=A0A4V0Z3E1_9BURK|nr:phosphatase PAP2 family protein [Pseudoduganella lutea]QBE63123.1 phosphatase PAP2 family protein [Pseudoduganella lutea]
MRFRNGSIAAGGLLLSALLILWIGQFTDIDLALADLAFDKATRTFPMQHAWLTETFNHVILKTVLSAMAALAVVLASWDTVRPSHYWSESRRIGLRVVAISAVLVPSMITVFKRFSISHCPWDLQRYRGSEPYVRLLEWVPAATSPGHCMPAGHASSALWLVSIAAFWWPYSRRKSIGVAIGMLFVGMTVGWMQQLRGAHFLTHTLWSAWIACAMVLVIYSMNAKGLARPKATGYNSVPAAAYE